MRRLAGQPQGIAPTYMSSGKFLSLFDGSRNNLPILSRLSKKRQKFI